MFNLSNIKIAFKMPLLVILSATVLAVGLGFLSYQSAASNASVAAKQSVTGVLDNRKASLLGYLKSIEEDIHSIATNPFTYEAEQAFAKAWKALGPEAEKTLQTAYIEKNPHPTGSKEKLDKADTGTPYDEAHGKYHPWFRTFLQQRGYYDIFLFDLNGDLVYSVFKELDYATNLNEGKYKDTDLGNAFRAAADSANNGSIHFFDFKPYSPSHGAPASFMSTSITDGAGKKTGVLVFQMPIDRINAVMSQEGGLGVTGETFFVGEDRLVRSASRFIKSDQILQLKVENEAISSALNGSAGFSKTDTYREGNYEIYTEPLSFNGVKWALAAAISEAEVLQPVVKLRNQILLQTFILLIIIGLVGYFVSRTITGPLSGITKVMDELTRGNTSVTIDAVNRGDEIGDIGRSLEVFSDGIKEKQLADERLLEEREIAVKRTQRIEDRINEFNALVSGLLSSFSASSQEMKESAISLSAIAEETNLQADNVSQSASAASANIQTVSTASEQLKASITAIANDAQQSQAAVEAAVIEVKNANKEVSGLVSLAEKIGNVVTLISDIAEQTNLLALNATIEAARAGEMGKGFAIVASEVKELASQTAKATEDISKQIADIRSATGTSVEAIEKIGSVVEQVNSSASAIATAVQQQDAATSNIANNMLDVAKRTEDVTNNIGDVTEGSQNTGKTADNTLEAATSLAEQSTKLQEEITKFLDDIKAA